MDAQKDTDKMCCVLCISISAWVLRPQMLIEIDETLCKTKIFKKFQRKKGENQKKNFFFLPNSIHQYIAP